MTQETSAEYLLNKINMYPMLIDDLLESSYNLINFEVV